MSARHDLTGRRLGSFLGGLATVASKTRIRVTQHDRARAYLQSIHPGAWVTIETIAEEVGITVSRAHDCVGGLFRQGHIERRFPSQRGRRQQPQEYRWRARA